MQIVMTQILPIRSVVRLLPTILVQGFAGTTIPCGTRYSITTPTPVLVILDHTIAACKMLVNDVTRKPVGT